MDNEFNGVANTSLLVAAMRDAESKRSEKEGRLFDDPFAEILAGPKGQQLRNEAIATSGDQPAIAIRTAFIDEKITDALKKGIKQIVMFASGMDSRAYRMNLSSAVKIFEIDQPAVLNYKSEKLKTFSPRCTRFEIPLDLRENWIQSLIDAGFNPNENTLWLTEGLLMYLQEAEVQTLLERINSFSRPNDIFIFDILSQTLLESPYMKAQLDFLIKIGAPWRFGINEPENFMDKLGWNATATQAAEYAPNRWPFPLIPRHIPGIPRGFYVHAVKRS